MLVPLKILMVYGGGDEGGAPEYLIRLLKNYPRNELEIHFASLHQDNLGEKISKMGIPYYQIAIKPSLKWNTYTKLKKLVKELQPDLINTHGVRANFYGRLAGAALKVPSITTVHSILEYDYTSELRKYAAKIVETFTMPLSSGYIANSSIIAEDLLNKGVKKENISIIHHGLDVGPFLQFGPKTRIKVREELEIPEDALVVGTVARLHPVKGISYLLKSVNYLAKQFPNVKFVVVGSGPSEAELKDQVKEQNIEDKVIFTGYRNDAQRIMTAFDVFVLPSIMEAFGLVLLEAMAVKLPIVATRVGGIPEIVLPGETGFLVPPKDEVLLAQALQEFIAKPELREKMGHNGYLRLQKDFTLERMVEKTTKVYCKVAEHHNS